MSYARFFINRAIRFVTNPVSIVVLIGIFLRLFNLASMPPLYPDENTYGYVATSLITHGRPIGGSMVPGLNGWGDPWFDHSFLYPFLISMVIRVNYLFSGHLPSTLGEAAGLYRIPSFMFSVFTLPLIYFLGKKLYSEKVGKIALAFFAFWPNAVMINRTAMIETTLTFFFVLTMYMLLRFLDSKKYKTLILVGVASGLCGLLKGTGVFVSIFIFLVLIFRRNYKEAAVSIMISLSIMSLYPISGLAWGWENFLQSTLWQGSRREPFLFILTDFAKDWYGVAIDWWFVFSLMAFVVLLIHFDSKDKILSAGILTYFLMIFGILQVFSSPSTSYPLFPLLAICVGKLFHESKPLLISILTTPIIIGYFVTSPFNLLNSQPLITYFLSLITVIIPVVLGLKKLPERVGKNLVFLYLILILSMGFLTIVYGLYIFNTPSYDPRWRDVPRPW